MMLRRALRYRAVRQAMSVAMLKATLWVSGVYLAGEVIDRWWNPFA